MDQKEMMEGLDAAAGGDIERHRYMTGDGQACPEEKASDRMDKEGRKDTEILGHIALNTQPGINVEPELAAMPSISAEPKPDAKPSISAEQEPDVKLSASAEPEPVAKLRENPGSESDMESEGKQAQWEAGFTDDSWSKAVRQPDDQLRTTQDDEYRAWLVRERIRMESERRQLENEREQLLLEQQQFESDKKKFDHEVKRFKEKVRYEKNRMNEERNFFDAKFRLLEDGFKRLAKDKEQFAYEKKMFETMKKVNQYHDEMKQDEESFGESGYIPIFFFKGVTSPLGLKKRYKDLIKIFHPDNLFGDHDTILRINKEYEMMKKKFNYQKKTV